MERPPPPPQPEFESGSILGALYARQVARPSAEKGLWSALYPALLEAIRAHRSTILFVNSRGLVERLCQRLNDLAAAGEGGAIPDLVPNLAPISLGPTMAASAMNNAPRSRRG